MTDVFFAPDEIGPWSEIKLEIIEKYAPAYTKAFSVKGRHLKKFYIDGFSGSGLHLSKGTKTPIEGSPARALKVLPAFDRLFSSILTKTRLTIFGRYVTVAAT
jgi:three-Cys-motif partner protein